VSGEELWVCILCRPGSDPWVGTSDPETEAGVGCPSCGRKGGVFPLREVASMPGLLERVDRVRRRTAPVPAPEDAFPAAPIPTGVPRGFDFLDPVDEGSALRMPRGPVERRRGRVRLADRLGSDDEG
jgi:hypothetical protein